jgi:beta-glucosidase
VLDGIRRRAARLGYVFGSNKPLYPFGYGLSYTTFSYGKPALDRVQIRAGETARASVTVTNTGARAGEEVVQMYVRHGVSSVVQPVLALRGFQRVHLTPGETKTVSFDLGPEQLAILDRQMKWTVEAGSAEILVGRDSVDLQGVALTVTR